MKMEQGNIEAAPIILVGTYRKDQLEHWILPCGLYNYPVHEEDSAILKDAPSASEIWLYAGKSGKRRFAASFEREVSASDLDALGYPRGKGKPHAERYLLFKVREITEGELPPKAGRDAPTARPPGKTRAKFATGGNPRILLRLGDFTRSAKVRAELKARFADGKTASPEEKKSSLYCLPDDLSTDWLDNLCVCEEAEQLDFCRLLGFGVDPERMKAKAVNSGRFTCLDFFAGSGLVSAAMANQFETVWANDISEKKALVFNANIKEQVLDIRPIETVDGHKLPSVDLSWGSFPCQDLSLAGDMNGLYASRSGLFWQWLRVMDEMRERPPVVVAENAACLVSSEDGKCYVRRMTA